MIAGGALLTTNTGVCLLAKQEPMGADAAVKRRSGPRGGACERSDLESVLKNRPVVVLKRRDHLQQWCKLVRRYLSMCLAIGIIIITFFVLMASFWFYENVSAGLGSRTGNELLNGYAKQSVSAGLGSRTGSERSSNFSIRDSLVGSCSWTGEKDSGDLIISLHAGRGSRTGRGVFWFWRK